MKDGWHDQHAKHTNIARITNADTLLIGDSIISNYSRYPNILRDVFECNPLNFGIGGDRTQHVMWRIQNGINPENIKRIS